MCLVLLAIGQSDHYPIILAGNRDEFHARPTQKANWWPDKPNLVGGRDLQAGGTWLAVHRKGRFATVTNFRDAEPASARFLSRGHLVTKFLESDQSPLAYLHAVDGSRYAGFNLVVGDTDHVAYLSNRGDGPREMPAGLYGLSNALLDAPWDKVLRSKRGLAALLDRNAVNETTLLRLLEDRDVGPVDDAESKRLGFTIARAITAPFIVTPDYGTRCSTVVTADRSGRWQIVERRFDPRGVSNGESRFTFDADA